jgi:16S rRNA (uracil1498-N3)-methyltransferase
MSKKRFFFPEINTDSAVVELDELQSAHLRTVLRLEAGAAIDVFDGRGNEFECVVTEHKRKTTLLKVVKEVSAAAAESTLRLTLGVPLIKPVNAELIVRKAVELGVTTVVPVVTEYCRNHSKRFNKERWEKIVIESSKQCGRALLMSIAPKQKFEEFILNSSGMRLFFSEVAGESLPEHLTDKEITAAIGPEGGWTKAESDFAIANSFVPIHFGGRILRAETAAITIAGILQHRYGDMN